MKGIGGAEEVRGGGALLWLPRHLRGEEIADVDELVGGGGSGCGGLALDGEGDDEVDGAVLGAPVVGGVLCKLRDERVDVAGEHLGHLGGKLLREALDELAGGASARVGVAALRVAADVLDVVELEALLVLRPNPQVGDHDVLTYLPVATKAIRHETAS